MVRYEQPIAGKIVKSWRYPSEVGWLRDLYRYPDADEAEAQWLEHEFFQRIDDQAAPVLARMLAPTPQELDAEQLSRWTTLVRSLMHRTPENLQKSLAALMRIQDHIEAEVRANYDEFRGPSDPTTYEAYAAQRDPHEGRRAALKQLPTLLLNPRIGTFLVNMKWRVLELDADCPRLMLSDDPICRTNGLANPGGHLAMPLSPDRFLLMAESDATMAHIASAPLRDLAKSLNIWTIESARRFVVSVDRRQDRFVENRMGQILNRV